ncbi:MAG: hypothetical protein GYA14_01900, partial [Ignavibacteria bacterium]|nr:hypothetical protein [Ignavibacteria bacterium]
RNENCFEITESDAGYIFPKTTNWDDYKFECNFKIVTKYFGCIIRAQNLSNYIMYQIRNDRKIWAHLRINGEWIVTEESSFERELKPDNWYRLTIICEKRSIRINIKEGKDSIIDRHFIIPPQIKIVYRKIDAKGKESIEPSQQVQNVDFDFGSIGVRNYGDERAFIKNVYLEKMGL